MNKIEKNLKQAQDNGSFLVAHLNNICKKICWNQLDTNRKKIPLHQKAKNNTIIRRRGTAGTQSSVMGVTIKATLKKTQQYILLEPRYGEDSFRSTYLKCLSSDKSDQIFLDTTAILIVDKPECKYYAIYEYSQVPENHITKGSKGRGNANRYSLNSINATPIPIEGLNSPLKEPGLEEAIINLIEKIGK